MANWGQIEVELKFSTSRSSGPGGQHANKVETKVIAYFDIRNSLALNEQEKQKVLKKLSQRINKKGLLYVYADKKRQQFGNKKLAVEKILQLIQNALKPLKSRKRTMVPKKEKEKRLRSKKKHSELKQHRKKVLF